MKITVESKEKTNKMTFPVLCRYLGSTGDECLPPKTLEESTIVLFYNETSGIVVQLGKAKTVRLGEINKFIPCSYKESWQICGSEIVVSFSN